MKNLALALLLCFVLMPVSGNCEEDKEEVGFELQPANLFTNDAEPLGLGVTEFVPIYTWTKSRQSFGPRGGWETGPDGFDDFRLQLQFLFGVHDDLDLIVTAGGATTSVVSGFKGKGWADGQLGVRWRFHEGEGHNLAYLSGFSLPMGNAELGPLIGPDQGMLSWDQSLVSTWELDRFTVSAELGLATALGRGSPIDVRNVAEVNLAAGYHITPTLKPLVECHLLHEVREGSPPGTVFDVTVGGLILFDEDSFMGLGVRRSLFGRDMPAITQYVFTFTASF